MHPFNKHKLEFRSKQCAFLGYNTLHKGYKCLDISSGRVYVSCDVFFDEQVFPFASLHSNAGAQLRKELLLLPSHLLPSPNFAHEGAGFAANNVSVSNANAHAESVQETGQPNVEDFGENSYDFMQENDNLHEAAAEDP